MGLFVHHIRFDSSPPSEEALRGELIRQTGSAYGLDGFALEGNVVEIAVMLEPVTGPYAVKILLGWGGVYLDFGTSKPHDPRLPAYVREPWLAWPWWKRAGIHVLFLLGLFSTALPRPKR